MSKTKVIIIAGPTASGKSSLAIELARLFNGELINADSMQVYRRMDIGSAKPSKEDLRSVRHHLIDIVDPDEDYTAADFRSDASKAIEEISSAGKTAFVVGGTGLYIKALTRGLFEGPPADKELRRKLTEEALEHGTPALYRRLAEDDPDAASGIHPNNTARIIRALEVHAVSGRPISEFHKEHGWGESPYDTLKIGLLKDRAALYAGIDARVERMVEAGLKEETAGLLSGGHPCGLKPMRALGYKEMSAHIRGEYALEEAVSLIKRNTRRYAKRQLTWFKKDPEIRWFSPEQKKDIISLVKEFLCLKDA